MRRSLEKETVRFHPSRMELPSNKDFFHAMAALRIVTTTVGIWPLQTYNFWSGLRTAIAIVLTLLLVLIVNMEIYLDYRHGDKILDGLVVIACGTQAVTKVALFRLYPTGLIANFVSAVKDYRELNEEEKRRIVRHHAYLGRILLIGMILPSYITATLIFIIPMLAGDAMMHFPVPSECTFELLQIPKHLHIVIYFGEYLIMLVIIIANPGSDSLFFAIIFHLCGQVEVLKLDFSKFPHEDHSKTDRFIALIKRHHHLLKLSKYLNDTIGSIMVVQLITSCLLICVSGFQFILSLNVYNIVMVTKTFMAMCILLGQMFAYSYVGEYSKNQFEGIGHVAYCSGWYNAPPNLSKDISFLLLKTQYPVQLKAGKFFVLNMETYTSILKTSMSYLSVLRVMVTA